MNRKGFKINNVEQTSILVFRLTAFWLLPLLFILFIYACDGHSKDELKDSPNAEILEKIEVSRQLADSNVQKSAHLAKDAMQLAKKIGDMDNYRKASLLLAPAYIKQMKYPDAQQIIAENLQAIRKSGPAEDQCRFYYLAGFIEAKELNFKGALVYYDSAFNLIKSFSWQKEKGSDEKRYDQVIAIMSGIGTVSIRLGMISPAIKTMSVNLSPEKPDELRMYTMGHIAELYRMTGAYDTTQQYLDQAIVIANRTNRAKYLIKLFGLKANVYYNLGKYDSCLYYNHKAEILTIAGKEARNDLPYIYNNLASAYQKTSNLPMAVVCFSKSLKLKEETHDSAGIAVTLSNLGIIYENWGKRKSALDYFQQALKINRALKNQVGIAKGYINLGEFFLIEAKYDSAIGYFRQALDIRRKLADVYGCIIALDGLGRSYRNQPDQKIHSMRYFSEAEQLAVKINAGYWIASLNYEIGELNRVSGNYNEAKRRFSTSIEYAQKEKQDGIVLDATRSLLEIALSEAGQPDLIRLFARYTEISDTIRKREKDEITADLLVKYETDRKEQENLLLKKEVGFQQLRLRSRIIQLIGLLFVVLILAVFGLVVYWLYRRKAQAYRIIVEQNIASVKNESRPEKGLGPLRAITPDNYGKMEESDRELLNRLLEYMELEEPYLNTDLSLDELCKKLNTNRTYLSNIINSVTGKNFHYFINQYRVAEARRILTGIKGDLYAVEEVGRMAGFGTKSSFYTCFKSVIGVTPAYYRDFVVAAQNK